MCPSFPDFKAKVKRPIGIKVSFVDQNGDDFEKNLNNFDARVFLASYEKL